MSYIISIQAIWESARLHKTTYFEVISKLDNMNPELLYEIQQKCEEFDRNVKYPYTTFSDGKSVTIHEDGSIDL